VQVKALRTLMLILMGIMWALALVNVAGSG
jgi:hypothetical protein